MRNKKFETLEKEFLVRNKEFHPLESNQQVIFVRLYSGLLLNDIAREENSTILLSNRVRSNDLLCRQICQALTLQ